VAIDFPVPSGFFFRPPLGSSRPGRPPPTTIHAQGFSPLLEPRMRMFPWVALTNGTVADGELPSGKLT